MGTVEKIVDVLNKMCNDRKQQTTTNYEIHSKWLKDELNKVKELLNNSSSNSSNSNNSNNSSNNSNNPHNSNEINEKEDDLNEIRQKRKSPEISENISRGSPQIKRTSTDFNEILLSFNLPNDLNKLKKEELLEVLEKYGNKSMSMKSLKKDLIDTLKIVLTDCYYQNQKSNRNDIPDQSLLSSLEIVASTSTSTTSAPITVSNSNETSVGATFDTTSIQLQSEVLRKSSIISSPARKVSMLAEVRHQVRSSILQERVESEEERQKRLAKEYAARRNRSSQVRMSQVSNILGQDDTRNRSASVNSVSSTNEQLQDQDQDKDQEHEQEQEDHEQEQDHEQNNNEDEHDNNVQSELQNNSQSQPDIASDEEDDEIVQPTDVKIEDDEQPEDEPDEHNNVWNEVPSPPPPTKPMLSQNQSTISSNNTTNEVESSSPAPSATTTSSTTCNDPTSSSFKLSNLVGGTQLSFLSNSSSTIIKPKEKAVVPALQHAQRLKEKEEAKAAQKKKEIEEKKKEHMKKLQATSATNSVNVSSSKLFQSTTSKLAKPLTSTPTPTSTTPSSIATLSSQSTTNNNSTANNNNNTVASSSTHVAPAPPLKKGFGWFRKDKDAIVTPTTTTTAPVAPVATNSLKANKDKLFTSSTTPTVTTTQSNHTVKEEEDNTVEDQENVKPFSSATSTIPQFSTSSSTVLSESKSIPTSASSQSKVIPPSTPLQSQQSHSQSQSKSQKEHVPLTPQSETNSYEASPVPNQSPPQPQYQIDDRDDSDASDTDGDNDEQSVPDWAKPPKLRQALERQYGLIPGIPAVDPDTIFPEVQTCVLEEIFGRSQGKCRVYSNRTSSGKWDADELTLIEKRKYRHQMGYTTAY